MSELYDSPELLTLEDENGEETVFEILDTMDLDDKTYVALTPYHENPEEMLEGDAELVVLSARPWTAKSSSPPSMMTRSMTGWAPSSWSA